MSQNPEFSMPVAPTQTVTTCLNCHSTMPSELRFCRNCGFRLGEGPAEYTETVRFDAARTGMPTTIPAALPVKKRRRMSGMAWIFVGLLTFFIAAAAFTALVTPIRQNAPGFTAPVTPRSYVGVNSFDTPEGIPGATFDMIEAPGVPADKAGLVGGDIITVFDGHAVNSDDEMMDLLSNTPIGKTVDVVYLRDGETKTTKLTTVAKEEYDRIVRAWRKRPEGNAQFGYDDGESERVPIEGTKTFGVKLNSIRRSLPADLAGIKEGDIVTKFDGVPIRTPEELRMRVLRALPYSTVTLEIMRNNEKMEIPVKMGKQ